MDRRFLCCSALLCTCTLLGVPDAAVASSQDERAKPSPKSEKPSLTKTKPVLSPGELEFQQRFNEASAQVQKFAAFRRRHDDYPQADSLRRQLKVLEEQSGAFERNDPRATDVDLLVGRWETLSGNLTADRYDKILAARERIFGAGSVPVLEVLSAKAALYARLGELPVARADLQKALDILEKNKGGGAASFVDGFELVHWHQANVLHDTLGALASRAAKYLQENLKPGDPAIARMQFILAKTEMGQERKYPYPTGNNDPAIVTLNEAISKFEKTGKDKLLLAEMYASLADRQRANGERSEAVRTFEKVVALRYAAAPDAHRLMASTYNEMASYLIGADQTSLAEEYKKRVLTIYENSPGRDDFDLINNGLSSIAEFYKSSGHREKAAPYLERMMTLKLQHRSDDHSGVVALAECYMEMKDYAKAEPVLKKWYSMWDHPRKGERGIYSGLVRIAESLGEADTHLNKLGEAEKYINVAKAYYDQQDKATAKFGEPYSERFLKVYTQFLQKSGRQDQLAIYQARLKELQTKIEIACEGCGRG